MTSVRLRFPASRYHANPWGRHVNEGVAEWPPSPYRLLRALYDVWKRKCPHLGESVMERLLGGLAQQHPSFALPTAVASHTRSYLSSNSEDPTDKSLIFDAFVAFNKEASCCLRWPNLELDAEEREALKLLLRNLNYLGRSESWVDADLAEHSADGEHVCVPLSLAAGSGQTVPVACVLSPTGYTGKRRWLDALTVSSTELIKGRLSAPPLLRMVRYVCPESFMENNPVRKVGRRPPDVRAVLLALDCTVLPLVTATIEVAEQVRVCLMGAHKQRMNNDRTRVSPLFSGKENGQKRMDHGHIFILPLGNQDLRIDRVLLLSNQQPFTEHELDAVRGVQSLWQGDDRPKVRCVVAWQGRLDAPGIRTRANVLISATPFVTVRHLHKRDDPSEFFRNEVRRECRNHGLPEPLSIEALSRPAGKFECVEFRRNRKDDPPRPGYAFRLEFQDPVLAPFSLGYGCHFGLGQFQAEGK